MAQTAALNKPDNLSRAHSIFSLAPILILVHRFLLVQIEYCTIFHTIHSTVSITFARKRHAHTHTNDTLIECKRATRKWTKRKRQATGQKKYSCILNHVLSAHFGSKQDKKLHRRTWIKRMQIVTTRDNEHDVWCVKHIAHWNSVPNIVWLV